jgi:uncharacterized alpha-E superfamily protein
MLSRVADSLYWMSRYLERAEHTARLLNVHLSVTLDQSHPAMTDRRRRLLSWLQSSEPNLSLRDDTHMVEQLAFDTANPSTIAYAITAARENARQVREEISTEMWQQLNQLYIFVRNSKSQGVWREQPHDFLQAIKQGSHLFQGITDSTMNHGQGWDFIQLGRFIERVLSGALMLDGEFQALQSAPDLSISTDTYLNWLGLLKGFTAFEAYSKIYTAEIQPRRVAEFLILAPHFPHSICFSVVAIQGALNAIAKSTDTQRSARLYRLAGRLHATLDYAQVDEIVAGGLHGYLDDIRRQVNQVHDAIYQMYISYPIEEKLLV